MSWLPGCGRTWSAPSGRVEFHWMNRGSYWPFTNQVWKDTRTWKNRTCEREIAISTRVDLSVTLGRLRLANPILVASGTFGYAREMAGVVDFKLLGGIIPKTTTRQPRPGNPPPRTVETPSGMLNAIGL